MKTTIAAIAAAGAIAFAGAAFADSTTDLYAANTVVATGANGAVLNFHFNADGRYVMKAGDQTVNGAWAVENGQFCITPDNDAKSCSPHAADRKVGDTWNVTGGDGVAYSVTVRAGR